MLHQKRRRQLRHKAQEQWRIGWKQAKKNFRTKLQDEGFTKPQRAALAGIKRWVVPRVYLPVPKICSFVYNPDELVDFVNKIGEQLSQKKTVQLDFQTAEILTSDVFTVLLSKVNDERFCPNLAQVLFYPPKKSSPTRLVWDNSGMASKLSIQSRALEQIEKQGDILYIGGKENATEQSVAMIQMAMEMLFGDKRDCQPIRSIIGELTLNTFEHASGKSEIKETWWSSVYFDKTRETICFSFVDNGVGIFETAKTRKLTALYGDYPLFGQERSQILRDIFTRKIPFNPSETGFSFRGKGLPLIYRRSQWNHIILNKAKNYTFESSGT